MGISRYLGFFLDETRGYLNTLERGIQALEAWPADSGRMHEIYLSVSSIHGMAATMGFTRMQRLAEDMEGALLQAERGRMPVTAEWKAILSECLRALGGYIDRIERTSEEGTDDCRTLRRELFRLSEEQEDGKGHTEELSAAFPKQRSQVLVEKEDLDQLMHQVGELIMLKNRFSQTADSSVWQELCDLEKLTAKLHDSVKRIRLIPFADVVGQFPRRVRELSRQLNKSMALYMTGTDTNLEKSAADEMGSLLWQLIRFAAENGIEGIQERIRQGKPQKGSIYLNILRKEDYVAVRIRHDGTKADIFKSEADVTAIRQSAEALGGEFYTVPLPEEGTAFEIRLFTFVPVIEALVVEVGRERYAIAMEAIRSAEDLAPEEIFISQAREYGYLKEKKVPLLRLGRRFGCEPTEADAHILKTVIVSDGETYVGLVVDRLAEKQEIVIKSLGNFMQKDPVIRGAAILNDKTIALVLNTDVLLQGGVEAGR
jgi:two-component system chemotaxis sensor kinase CheA